MENCPRAGGRLRQLRLREGLTQAEFSKLLGTTQYRISRIEHGEEEIPISMVASAISKYDLAPDYFERPPHQYGRESLNFRKTNMPKKLQDRIIATFSELEEFVSATAIRIPQANLAMERPKSESLLTLQDISEFAKATRDLMRLGGGPVGNVTRAMESAGVVVAPLEIPGIELNHFEGVSSPIATPTIRLTAFAKSRSGDRHRFTLAHELGHLVMHTVNRPEDSKIREEEANLFAGEFLLPAELLMGRVDENTTLSRFAELKSETGVSIQALIRRAKSLGLLSAERYKSLNIQLSGRGWRKREPVDVEMENGVLYPKILAEAESRNVISIFRKNRSSDSNLAPGIAGPL